MQGLKIEQEYKPMGNLLILQSTPSRFYCHHDMDSSMGYICQKIGEYGHNPENNFEHFMHSQTKSKRNKFLSYEQRYGIMIQRSTSNVWYLFPNGILAPREERLRILIDLMEYSLVQHKAKKLVVELEDSLKYELFSYLENQDRYRTLKMAYVLYWPLYRMDSWDHMLSGKEWKKIRNMINFVERNHKLEFRDPRDMDKESCRKLIDEWTRNRKAKDIVDKHYFYNLVESGFRGFDVCRSIIVDGKLSTITAGWRIPNSNAYYSAIGILNYDVNHIGIYANIDDLRNLKRQGFEWVDFGGGPKEIIEFKKKFKPERIYKTYSFSIVLK